MGFWENEDIEKWFWDRIIELDKEGYELIKENVHKLSEKEFIELIKEAKRKGYRKFILTYPIKGVRHLLGKK